MLDIIDLQVEISGEKILNGVTLTIDPGVEVVFEGAYKIEVQGGKWVESSYKF